MQQRDLARLASPRPLSADLHLSVPVQKPPLIIRAAMRQGMQHIAEASSRAAGRLGNVSGYSTHKLFTHPLIANTSATEAGRRQRTTKLFSTVFIDVRCLAMFLPKDRPQGQS